MSQPANEFEGFQFSRNISPREVTGGIGLLGAAEAIREAARRGLENAAKDVVLKSAKEQAPLLEPESMKRAGRVGGNQGGVPGELRDSGKVEMVADDTAAISFNTIYASLQHERMDWHHTHGNAKYLERAMVETRPEQVEAIAKAIREVTGGD